MRISQYFGDGKTHHLVKHATRGPYPTDDSFSIGAKWYDASDDDMYICTRNETDNAKWTAFKGNIDTLLPIDISTVVGDYARIYLANSNCDSAILYNFTVDKTLILHQFDVGQTVTIYVDVNSTYGLTWPFSCYWLGGEEPSWSTDANVIDEVILTHVQTNRYHAAATLGFTGPAYAPPVAPVDGFATEPEAIADPQDVNLSSLVEDEDFVTGNYTLG